MATITKVVATKSGRGAKEIVVTACKQHKTVCPLFRYINADGVDIHGSKEPDKYCKPVCMTSPSPNRFHTRSLKKQAFSSEWVKMPKWCPLADGDLVLDFRVYSIKEL